MTPDTKTQLRSVAKTTGVLVAAAGVVTAITMVTLAPTPPKSVELSWDYPSNEVGDVIFEIVGKTNLSATWRVVTNVVGTNRVRLPMNQSQEFFTISRVMNRQFTNVQTVQRGFTQWTN